MKKFYPLLTIFGLLFGIWLLYLGYYSWSNYAEAKVSIEENKYSIKDREHFSFKIVGDKQQYLLITPDNPEDGHVNVRFDHPFISDFEMREDKRLYQESPPASFSSEEYYNIYVYDILTPEAAPLKIDMVALAKKLGFNRFTNYSLRFGPEGRILKLETSPDGPHYLYNLDTEELTPYDLGSPLPNFNRDNPNYKLLTWAINLTALDSIIAQQTGFTLLFDRYLSAGEMDLEVLENTNFYQEEPELVRALVKDKAKLILLEDRYTPEEWFNTLIHWFAPAGQEVMDISAVDLETKERTPIRSYQEFQAWAEVHLSD